MQRSNWVRLGTVVCASVVISVAGPGLAAAQQTSGGTSPAGVQAPANQGAPATVQLPRTGNPDAETTPSMGALPVLALAGGALATVVLIRRRTRREPGR
jgi:hypothetical protein